MFLTFLIALSMAFSCFSMTREVENNLIKKNKLCTYHGPEVGIRFLTYIINQKETKNVDAIHYLYHRSILNKSLEREEEFLKDQQHLEILMNLDENCYKEFHEYYDEK